MVLAKYLLTTAAAVVLSSAKTRALTDLKTDWEAYVSALAMPSVIDMTQGGHLDIDIGQASHAWTEDGSISGDVYGYAIMGQTPSFPGPSIVVAKDVPISITWHNNLKAPHLLADSVEQSILLNESTCYPNCGVPAVTHLHGGEVPAKYDGLPFKTIYTDESRRFEYQNRQLESTAIYHDHADGLNRLNTWAGLMGAYIIQNATKEAELNLNIETDIPLVINDRLIDNSGKLSYSDDNCNTATGTVWVPESFGNVNLVNGRVMPYVEIPPTQVRFRVVNAANSRHYQLPIPFPDSCQVVATDSGYVETPQILGDLLVLFPLERIELVCDFTGVADGTAYELVDVQSSTQSTPYDPRVLQIRIVESLLTDSMTVREIPTTLNKFKSLKTLYEAGGMERNVTLGEMTDAQACPTMEITYDQDKQINISTIADALQCVKGTVEKWNFMNPSADAHPFHWHLVHVQCGDTVDTIKTNELKDVAVVPSAGDRAADTIMQVCYVACTPGDYLIEGSERKPKDFGFDTTESYVAHCHILEHEENMMMSWFRIIDEYRAGGSSSSSGSGSWSEACSNFARNLSTTGCGSWPDVGSEGYDHTGHTTPADQDGLPAKNVSFADYHGFGTDEYAKYHRCDGHLKKHGAYSSTSGAYDDATQQMNEGNFMTAISSTVVSNSKQDEYGNPTTGSAAATLQDTQTYVETSSGINEDAGENSAATTGQGYVETAFEVQDAATSNTSLLADVKSDGTNVGKTGTDQSSVKRSSGVEGSVASSTVAGATIENSTGSDDSETTSTIDDANQGYSSAKTSGTIVNSTTYYSGAVDYTNSKITSINYVDVNQASAVNSTSYESSTLGKPADSTEADVNAEKGYISSSATNGVGSSVEGATVAQSNAETDISTTPNANTGTYTAVASSTKTGHLRQRDGV